MNSLPDNWTEADVEAVIAFNDPVYLVEVAISVSLGSPSRVWAEQICLRLSRHEDTAVRGNAIQGFGHIARIFRSLNRSMIEPVILAALNDPNEWVRGKAGDAADDVEWFLGWVLPGREHKKNHPMAPPLDSDCC